MQDCAADLWILKAIADSGKKDILAVVREHGETGSYRDPKWEPTITRLGDQLDSSIADAIGEHTLADLLDQGTK